MRVYFMKAYRTAVFMQLMSGSNVTVKAYRDGVIRCQTCLRTDCENARMAHEYLDSAYAEDALRSVAVAA